MRRKSSVLYVAVYIAILLAGGLHAVFADGGDAVLHAAAPVDPRGTPLPPVAVGAEHSHYLPLVMQPVVLYLPFAASPPAFAAPFPDDGGTRKSLNAYLAWDVVEPRLQVDGVTFSIYLDPGDPTPDTAIAHGLTVPSFDPVTFEADTQYFWQVVAVDADGRSVTGPVWSFRTDFFPDVPEWGAMVDVPAGTFMMGCDPQHNGGYPCSFEDTPLHEVYLDAYQIDKYEVTNQEYRACVDAGACALPRKFGSASRNTYFYDPQYAYYPVIFVSHWDAQDYCAWVGKRLPTEAEWEKAARGPIDTRAFPWGDEGVDCTRANHMCFDAEDTMPVTDYPAGQSPYGLMNVSGNVWEWVQDYYYDFYYAMSPYMNPVLTTSLQNETIPYFTVRGGCFRNVWWYLRTSHRKAGHWGDNVTESTNDMPRFRSNMYGFRCARDVPTP